MHPKYSTFTTLYAPCYRPGDYVPIRVLMLRLIVAED